MVVWNIFFKSVPCLALDFCSKQKHMLNKTALPFKSILLEGFHWNAPFAQVISVGCVRPPIIRSDPPQLSSITIRPCHTSCYINAHGRSPSNGVPCSLAGQFSCLWHSLPTGIFSSYGVIADGTILHHKQTLLGSYDSNEIINNRYHGCRHLPFILKG